MSSSYCLALSICCEFRIGLLLTLLILNPLSAAAPPPSPSPYDDVLNDCYAGLPPVAAEAAYVPGRLLPEGGIYPPYYYYYYDY